MFPNPPAVGRMRRPSAGELRVWRDYIETADLLAVELGRRLQADSGLSRADYRVLLALSEAPARMLRSSELAESIGWERSRLSHHLRRMETRGLVRRATTAGDQRGADVALTAEGAQAFRRGSVPHLEAVRELFVEALEPADLEAVARATAALRTHLTAPSPGM